MEVTGYKIHREIGKGGMAVAYLATQESLDREVVLKILNITSQMDNESHIERFLSEGRIVASLNHPNIITIYDIGISHDILFISMEFVEGGDLKSRMKSPMDPLDALNIAYKISSGLDLAHKNGIVHRDVKPANILFRDDDTPLLTDFGIAKHVDQDADLTSTGMFIGSPNYVSPEQADGSDIDGRTDIYSLGCILYEMLTGKKPYSANTVVDIVIMHKQSPIPRLPEHLKPYQALIDKMMAKNRNERFDNATILCAYISDIIKKQTQYDLTAGSSSEINKSSTGQKKSLRWLVVLLFISAFFFTSMNFLEIRLKQQDSPLKNVTIDTELSNNINLIEISSEQKPITSDPEETSNEPPSTEVVNALFWLGNQSLEEYRLTYPPKDNAFYYFSRLLEIKPGDRAAINGLLNIADRYALLAENELANNNFEKVEAYINIGLRINPKNKNLLRLKELNQELGQHTLLDTVKGLFN